MNKRFTVQSNGACGDPECCGGYEEYIEDSGDSDVDDLGSAVDLLNEWDAHIQHLESENAKLRDKIEKIKALKSRSIDVNEDYFGDFIEKEDLDEILQEDEKTK